MSDGIYYYALQSEARERTQKALNARILREPGSLEAFDKITLCSIASPDMPNSLEFAMNEWPKHYSKDGFQGFSKTWEKIAMPLILDHDAFNLAIWQKVDDEQTLVGLAVGTPSHARTHLTVKWVERFLGYSPVAGRVLLIVLSCAEEYAKLLGSERVLVKDPLVPQLYERYGYKPYRHPYVAHGGKYMAKELE